MQYNDDTAFQWAILANPADTTLKLVYADWLQDRSDPRAEYVRLQLDIPRLEAEARDKAATYQFPMSPVQINEARRGDWEKVEQERRRLTELGRGLDPVWVGFMNSLAQPFVPVTFQRREPGHPFTESVGLRGRVVTFESQYRPADSCDAGLLADLAFLTGVEWGRCYYGASDREIHGFVCELPADRDPLTAEDVLRAIKVANFRSEHIGRLDRTSIRYPGYHPGTLNDEIHTGSGGQKMFGPEKSRVKSPGKHELLKRYVTGRRLWYALLHIGEMQSPMVTLLAVGRSPHGNRLVGAITSQVCHNLCD